MRFRLPKRHGRLVTLASLLSMTLVAVATGGVVSGTAASQERIVIHEHGKSIQAATAGSGVRGAFTIDLKGLPFGPAGTTLYEGAPGSTRYVHGQAQVPFRATNRLTSKTGQMNLVVNGTRIDINPKVTSSGNVFGPTVKYGTWKIAAATGIYEGWKGGGNFAAAFYGYKNLQPYSIEWDGYITP